METFFEFVRNAIVFCPAALLLNPVLSNVFKLATMVADTDDAKMCRESLRFLALLLDKTGLRALMWIYRRRSTPGHASNLRCLPFGCQGLRNASVVLQKLPVLLQKPIHE